MEPRPGDKVWIVPSPGVDPHLAIVIQLSSDKKRALVLSGTGTGPRDIPHVVVDPERRANKALKLSKKTYFYRDALHVRPVDELKCRETPALRCPLVLWGQLKVLAMEGARAKFSTREFHEWWPELSVEPTSEK
jgi:hypothetical protein